MLSIHSWIRACKQQVISVQQIPASAKLFYSKDSSSSSDSESSTDTEKSEKQETSSDSTKATTQTKPPIGNIINKQAKPFMASITQKQGNQFARNVIGKRQEPFINSISRKQMKPFIDNLPRKQRNPFVDSTPEEQQKPIIDSKTGKEAKPFIQSIRESQAQLSRKSTYAQEAKQSNVPRRLSGSWENSWRQADWQAVREKRQQQPNMQSISAQLLQRKTVEAAQNIASKFGDQKQSVLSELMNKYVTDNQNAMDNARFSMKQMKDQMPMQNENPAEAVDESWSYKITAAKRAGLRNVGAKKGVFMRERGGRELHSEEVIRFIQQDIASPATYEPELSTWKAESQKYLSYLARHYPKNAFEEMIQWTEKGLLWKFPIDNEQGMEEEYNVHFSEHVFLERHLKDWCPTQGPVRHFMDLVCIGLSKNPYMTVQEKTDNITWYRDYFADKSDILLEVGAITARIPKKTMELTE